MDFKKKLKTRLYTGISYIILGIVIILTTFLVKTENDFISTFGFILIIMGIVRIRNYKIITKDEETIRKQEIAEIDERNILIMHKAKSTAFSIYVLLLCLSVIILSFLNMHEIAKWIAYSAFLLILIYWICYFIYQKKS